MDLVSFWDHLVDGDGDDAAELLPVQQHRAAVRPYLERLNGEIKRLSRIRNNAAEAVSTNCAMGLHQPSALPHHLIGIDEADDFAYEQLRIESFIAGCFAARFIPLGDDLIRARRHRSPKGMSTPGRRYGLIVAGTVITCLLLALSSAQATAARRERMQATALPAAGAKTEAEPGARPAGAFTGTAAADGIRVGLAIPSFLLVESFVDGGGPSAQASLDSLGTSRGFASFPYPGETGIALPGLIGTLTGKSIPGYPFYVASSSPTTPDSGAHQPGYHLASHSDASASTASAQIGETTTSGVEGGAFSTASVTAGPDGTVVSQSSSRVDLSLGALRLSGLESTARVELRPGGTPVRTSSLKVHELSLAGITIGVTDRGLVVGNLVVPLGEVLGSVGQMLSGNGTSVQFLPATQTPDSILSAGLLIKTLQPLPVVEHPAEVTITIGRVFAMASASVAAPTEPPGSLTPQVPSSPGDNGLPAATAAAPVIPTGPQPAPPAPTGPEVVPAPRAPARPIHRLAMTASKWAFYPIVALGAVVVLAASLGSSAGSRRRRKETWAWSS